MSRIGQLPGDGEKFYGQNDAVAAGMLRMTRLEACRGCGSVHPWARKPMVQTWECPDCGFPVGRPQSIVVRQRLPGLAGIAVDLCFGFADYLRQIAERLKS